MYRSSSKAKFQRRKERRASIDVEDDTKEETKSVSGDGSNKKRRASSDSGTTKQRTPPSIAFQVSEPSAEKAQGGPRTRDGR